MNKTFATFSKALKKDRYLESIQAHFLSLPSYRRFPSDEEFQRDLQTRDLYNFRSRSYWLRRLENHGRKERVSVDQYTIEHILPQSPELSATWRQALGSDWQRVQKQWLHTIGNLTLTGYNSEYSDRPFVEKRDIRGGFKESPLRLNAGLGQIEAWNAEAIQMRAGRLAAMGLDAWDAPDLDAATVESYRPQRAPASSGYTIEDHMLLAAGPLHDVFEAFSKAVLALDPCVVESFTKKYVAYRAETNFADILPQSHRLRLGLNIGIAEIHDPMGLCREVTRASTTGTRKVELDLTSLDDLPPVMGLVRQSLERQLGDGGQK